MIDYGGCTKGELYEVCESLAVQLIMMQNPFKYEVSEGEILQKLREEGLPVTRDY